jgi:hypothetical protein
MTRFSLLFGIIISVHLNAQLPGFTLTGNPENTNGATWTYQQTINGTVYNLKGILFKPIGTGVFPSVIVNHGTGGNSNPNGYSDRVCKKMVTWGYVCIATNYTHAGQGAPCGASGLCDTTNWGASNDNFLRAMKCWDILMDCFGLIRSDRAMKFTISISEQITRDSSTIQVVRFKTSCRKCAGSFIGIY